MIFFRTNYQQSPGFTDIWSLNICAQSLSISSSKKQSLSKLSTYGIMFLKLLLLDFGFASLWANSSKNFLIFVSLLSCRVICVDDLVLTDNCTKFLEGVIEKLYSWISSFDIRSLYFFFLDIEVIPTAIGVFFSFHTTKILEIFYPLLVWRFAINWLF